MEDLFNEVRWKSKNYVFNQFHRQVSNIILIWKASGNNTIWFISKNLYNVIAVKMFFLILKLAKILRVFTMIREMTCWNWDTRFQILQISANTNRQISNSTRSMEVIKINMRKLEKTWHQ